MTTFTTEDREYSTQHPWPENPWVEVHPELTSTELWEEKWGRHWVEAVKKDWSNQTSIQYFWPLTEQIGLELDYTGCAKKSTITYGNGSTSNLTWGTVGMSTIQPQLTITPNNPVGTLSIGGINIGMEKKPNILQRVIHKLLGFDWKDK